MATQSAQSIEYVRVPVALVSNGLPVDPTGDAVEFAFPLHDVPPVSGDWHAGDWETAADGTYYARALVGTGSFVLAVGNYDIWIKITATPEVPARNTGALQVTG